MKKVILFILIQIFLYILVPESIHQYISHNSCLATANFLNGNVSNCNK